MLHTVNKSPFEKNTLESCLRLAANGSDILLIEDGVVGAVKGSQFEANIIAAIKRINLFVLEPDLQARGFNAEKIIPGVQLVDYSGFVDLVANNANFQAWL